MREKKLKRVYLNSFESILIDTCILVTLFNSHESDHKKSIEIQDFLNQNSTKPKLILDLNLVELFYKCRKKLSPSEINTNLERYSIVRLPVSSLIMDQAFKTYIKQNDIDTFDYADYCICHVGLSMSKTAIITIDSRDFTNAYNFARSMNSDFNDSTSFIHKI